ncbi:DUF4347 domain-containing protein [Anabaena minutissima FACHB-250]|nr:DUF4347 domain-containing protein [Anabaena minutissima FACHB-250]
MDSLTPSPLQPPLNLPIPDGLDPRNPFSPESSVIVSIGSDVLGAITEIPENLTVSSLNESVLDDLKNNHVPGHFLDTLPLNKFAGTTDLLTGINKGELLAGSHAIGTLQTGTQSPKELLIIDPSVDDAQSLRAGVKSGIAIAVLDPSQDGVIQIQNILAGYNNLSAVHIVSHGEAGLLQLGSTQLSSQNIAAYTNALQNWGTALTEAGDIVLYGCDVASNPIGTAFVQQISQLTGADVAASDDLTGAVEQGGDWDLEYQFGAIESNLALLPSTLNQYQGLLAADSVVSGLTNSLITGLEAVGTEIKDLIADNPLFSSYVPGIVETKTLGDNVYQVSPTLGEAMGIAVDVTTTNYPSSFDFTPTGNTTLADRYTYIISSTLETLNLFYGDDATDEAALKTIDLNNDGRASWDEAFKVMVVGQVQDYLSNVSISDQDSDSDIDQADLAKQVENFLDGSILLSSKLEVPDFLSDHLQINVDGASSVYKNNSLTWNLDFSLSLFQSDRFDLGKEAEELGIALDPGIPPNPNNNPYTLPVERTIDFGSLIFGVKGANDGVGANDFFFAAPDRAANPNDGVRIGVNVGSPGSPYNTNLVGLDVNVGFLGAEIISSPNTGVVLDMNLLGATVDPSNPVALGFTENQQGSSDSDGTIEAANIIDLIKLSSTPIEFVLKIGTSNQSVETEITLPSDNYANTAAVITALNTAIAGTALNGIVSAADDDSDGKIELKIVTTDPTLLGFSTESSNNNTLIATNASSLIGSSSSTAIAFLLAVGESAPQLVTVTTTPTGDDEGGDGDPDNGVTNQLSLTGLRDDLQAALDAAFGAGVVSASISDDKLTISASGRLEISRTLTLDTLEQITLSELQGTSQSFDVDADPNAAFEVNLKLKALPGLKKADNSDYLPEGTIKVDINPLAANAVEKAVVDVDPIELEEIVSARYELTDAAGNPLTGGNSDLQDMLDFNVISSADILSTFTQIGTWFDRLSASSLLQSFDIPFADTTLGDLLNFKDLIADTFLIDDGDDGVKAPNASDTDIDDVERLLKWIDTDSSDVINYQLRTLFGNAQQLETRLNTLLSPLDVDARVFTDDQGRQNLTYKLAIADVTLDVNPNVQGNQPLSVPLDFELNLDPIANFETSGKLNITASGEIGFTLGILLGDAVPILDSGTEVETLNSDAGVKLNTNLALTTLGNVEPLVGRLSTDASFTLTTFAGTTPTNYTVNLSKSNTDDNKAIADLVADLNASLNAAGLLNKIVAEAEPIQGDTKTTRIVLRAIDSAIDRFQVVTSTNNTAFTELGLQTQSASTVSLIASQAVKSANPGENVSFKIGIIRTGGSSTLTVNLPTSDTAENVSLQSLINDLNAQLPSGIVASQSSGFLVLSAIDKDITAFTVFDDDGDPDVVKLGFDLTAVNNALTAVGVTELPTTLVAGVQLRGGATPQDLFGRLSADVTFTINGESVTVQAAATAGNTSIIDLVRSLNGAIAANLNLKGKIAAINDGYRIALRAIDTSISTIAIAGLNSAESTALGIANGSSGSGLALYTSSTAPVSYGVSEDTNFTVTINGNNYNATLTRNNTILNRSLYDLAASINNAINAAVGGVNQNPLIATVQSGQIVIGLKTSGTSTNLIGDPSTASDGIKPSDVTSFSINSANNTFANELKLIAAPNTANLADRADFIIYFRDGSSARISLDALDTNTDQLLDGNLGDLITEIENQAGGKLDIQFGSDGTSLKLVDLTGGTNQFKVVAVNGSPAASQLGILGSDTSSVNLNEVPADGSVPVADGVIDGGRIATIDLVDRIYLKDIGAAAELTIKTAGVVSAEASFGFAGIKVESNADQTLFSAVAELPLFNGQKTLSELFDVLSDQTGNSLANLVGNPTLTLDGNFDLKVSILPGLDISAFIPPVNPTITFKTDNIVIDLSQINAPLPSGQLFPDFGIDIQANNFGDLLKFEDIKFNNVLDAVQAIATFLSQFETFGFLGDEIPVLGLSVNELLDIADDFQQAVNDFRDNPAGGIQSLAQKIREAFGLPNFANNTERDAFFNNLGIPVPPGLSQLIEFALAGDVLKFDLRLPVSFSKGLNVDLDLGEALGVDLGPIDIQGGAGLATSGYLDARLSFGIDLNNPTNLLIYDDTTGVYGHLGANASNLQFNAAIGPVGAFIKDGLVNLDLDFNVTGNDNDGNGESLTDFLNQLNASLSGNAEATLPVFFPSDSEYLGDITFNAGLALSGDNLDLTAPTLNLPDFSNIDLSAINPFGSIPLMLDSLDFFLQGLQDILDGEVFGIDLPLIGNQLQSGADFIEKLRRDVLTPIRQYAEQAPALGKELVQKLLYSLLGSGSSGVTVLNPLTNATQSLQSFLGLSSDFTGLGLLRDYATGAGGGAVGVDDIVASDDGTGALWQFRLGGQAPISVDVAFDLGIPALALEADAALDINLSWGLALGLGINTTDGAYILIGGHDDDFGDTELQVTLDVDVADGSTLTGSLGFLQLVIAESNAADPGLENEGRGTYLHGEFGVDITNGGTNDTKLSFSELGNIKAVVELSAEAEVNLELTAKFNPEIIPDAIAALLPEISGRFILDWETGDIFADNFDFATSLSLLGFRDVSVNMGSFINEFLKPFVEKIAEVTEPLQPIIDIITAPIPVISDLAGQPISLVDIAGMTGYVEPAMIYAIADIISLVNKIGGGNYGNFGLPLGDFLLIDSASGNSNYLTGSQLLTPGYQLASDSKFNPDNISDFLNDTLGGLGSFGDLLNSGSGDTNSKDLVSGLASGTEGGSGFAFPVFDDPSLLFGLLLGQDIPIITYDLAPFGMDFSYAQKFPIWDALFIRIGGSVGLTIDLAFGYDTKGVREFADGNFSNPLDLLAGLYVSDTDQPTGEGTDVPELIFQGELFAGAELNLGVASAGAEGVIGLITNFDLYDPDSDGRVRIDELLGNFLYEWNYGSPALAPIAIFDVYGQVYAQLRAFVEALFFKIEFEITPPITLFEFSIPFEREPFLATERGDGSLLLNIGPNSAQRLNGDTRDIDEKIYVKSISESKVLVWGMGINEGDAQEYEVDPTKGIFAYGGAGNDVIDLSRVTHNIRYTLEGGVGDDIIKGSAGGGSMKGDLGNDELTGGAGVDLIFGGEGNDIIDGKESADRLFGDTGIISEITGGERFRSFVGEKDGDDKILGGDGADIIFGGGGSDTIEGQAGDDIAIGDGGNFDTNGSSLKRLPDGRYDVNARGAGAKDKIFGNAGQDALFGGAGDDLIDGGADSDEIEAGEGFDVVYGGSGADTIYGGTNDDIIFGNRDPQGATFGLPGDIADVAADGVDTIFGEEGNDFIRGQAANDKIYGGSGADILFGDTGNDEIYGEAGGDIIFGGADNDTIDGDDGADIAFGDDGLVVYVDFDPSRADFNVTGSRIRFVNGDQLIGDSSESLINGYSADTVATSRDLIVTQALATDGSDVIVGGDGNDIVFGGGGSLDQLFGDFDPSASFSGPRPNGQDILIGDGGRIELNGRRNQRAAAESNALDGIDQITGNDGGDYIFGGGEQDTIYGFQQAAGIQPLDGVADNDVILGDNGEILFDTSDAKNRIKIVRTVSVAGDSGKSDVIDGDFGNDIIFGGLNSSADVINGDVGDDVLLGDNGEIRFDLDGDLDTLDLVESYTDGLGGGDEISGNDGNDILIGGTAGDIMSGNNGEDILLGDNARIELAGSTGRLLVQVAAMPAPTAIDFITTTDVAESTGGADIMSGNAGNDILLGGVNNGGTDTMYGDAATPVNAVDGDDILLGDNGKLDFTLDSDTNRLTLDLISSTRDGLGGTDNITGNAGADIAIGGTGGDIIYGDNATASGGNTDQGDILLGDNGDVFTKGAFGGNARLKALGTGVSLITTTDIAESTGGSDTISGNAGSDVILGGVNGDVLYGDATNPVNALDGDDVVLGDNGKLDFAADLNLSLTPTATDLTTLDLIQSFTDALGGSDTISGNAGADTVLGGSAGDVIFGDNASASGGNTDKNDILLGDNGEIKLVSPALDTNINGSDRIVILGGAVATVRSTDNGGSATGGQDTVSGNAGGDIILGGVLGDTLYGDRANPTNSTNTLDGNDTILGDNGALEWLSTGRLNEITGIDINANNPSLFAAFSTADTNLDTLDLITTEQPNNGGRDLIYGDNGRDVIFGGTNADELYGDTGSELDSIQSSNGNDLMFGDHGRLYPQFSTLPNIYSRNFFAIDIGNTAGGEGDRMWGEEGDDIMLGQQGDDRMFGGSGDDDMIGGHNVSGGVDELTTPAVQVNLNVAIGTPAISGVNDLMDGGSGNDAMTGDNAIVWRRGDDLSPRFRNLTAATIYTTTNDTITTNVGATAQSDPEDTVGRDIQLVDHDFTVQGNPLGRFGNDVMAGGSDRDVMFGQLGNDLMQGDGFLQIGGVTDGAATTRQVNVTDSGVPTTAGTIFFKVPEQATDGNDYLEGNGGNDLMYGGLGQDDMIGGSSALFGLTTAQQRPDGSDLIFGGAGVDISRNNIGDGEATIDANGLITTTATGHARDADYIMGDNANIFRLVQGSASGTNPTDPNDNFRAFTYDNYGSLKIIPRAMQQLDYTLGGADYAGGTYNNGAANADNGAADVIHGESGDDTIFGMTGSDILFGEGQDDDIIGGYGHDWISGGTGQDGVLGDDGLISTSRNGLAETLYGITATTEQTISTPGKIQSAIINVTGELKKTVDLVPFSYDRNWNATDDEFPNNTNASPFADDIIFGGLGSDFLHGGSGDDAISGAEALANAYVPVFNNGTPVSILNLGYSAVGLPSTVNPGNVLAFNSLDTDGQHQNNRFRPGEFYLYDEYDPLRKIQIDASGNLWKSATQGTAYEFLLNFNKDEGVFRPGGTVPKATGQQSETYGAVKDDGNDAIFGDLGNDWLVGGTGRDNVYGGWGNDLINVDDDQTTNTNQNNQPDTHPTYEDRAYGGAGRDILIGNTGGDRLIDWVGEYNSYLVPFAPFGMATVSRTLQPQLPEFLYALSKADGADPTRNADTGADPLRNGEPNGELGLVLQKDFAWQDQTGAPADPQAGNIPGGKRDILRSAGFNNGLAEGFVPDSGTWTVTSGRYQVSPSVTAGDAVSVFYVDSPFPPYVEITATVNAVKPTAGTKSNAYLLYDYQSPTDFKFAGINVSTNKLESGQRTAAGWFVKQQASFTSSIRSGVDYNLFLALNGNTATLTVNNQTTLSFTFASSVDTYGRQHTLRDGMVGLGAQNAIAQIDNVVVQVIPPSYTVNKSTDFSTFPSDLFSAPVSGQWQLTNGQFNAQPSAGGSVAINLINQAFAPPATVELSVKVNSQISAQGGFVFAYNSSTDYKFVVISPQTNQVMIGHYTERGITYDAISSLTILPETNYTLGLKLHGAKATVIFNGLTVIEFTYNSLLTGGSAGLLSLTGLTIFDDLSLKTDYSV